MWGTQLKSSRQGQNPLDYAENALAIHVVPQLCCGCLSNMPCSLLPSDLMVAAMVWFLNKDGMDQAKWSIPRQRFARLTKAEMPLQKPKFKIQGVWIHCPDKEPFCTERFKDW